jgi:hypothetical protein
MRIGKRRYGCRVDLDVEVWLVPSHDPTPAEWELPCAAVYETRLLVWDLGGPLHVHRGLPLLGPLVYRLPDQRSCRLSFDRSAVTTSTIPADSSTTQRGFGRIVDRRALPISGSIAFGSGSSCFKRRGRSGLVMRRRAFLDVDAKTDQCSGRRMTGCLPSARRFQSS